MRKRGRLLWITGLVTALALLGAGAWAATKPAAGSTLVFGKVISGSLTQTLAASGTVEQADEVSVAFPASAEVTGVYAEVGDEVQAGDKLASIDKSALQQAVDEAELAVLQAQDELETAQEQAEASDEEESEDASASASPQASTAGVESSGVQGPTSSNAGQGSDATSQQGAASSSPSQPAPSSSASASPSTSASKADGDSGQTTGAPPSGAISDSAADAKLTAAKDALKTAQASYTSAWQRFSTALASAIGTCTTSLTATTEPASFTGSTELSVKNAAWPAEEIVEATATPTAETSEALVSEGSATPTTPAQSSSSETANSSEEPTDTPTPSIEPIQEPTATSTPATDPSPSETSSPTAPQSSAPATPAVDASACIAALDGLASFEAAVVAAEQDIDQATDALLNWADNVYSDSGSTDSGQTGGTAPGSETTTPATKPSAASSASSAPVVGGQAASGSASTSSGQSGVTDTTTGGSSESPSGSTGAAAPTETAQSGVGGQDSGSGAMGANKTVAQAEAALAEAELNLTTATLASNQAVLLAPADGILTTLPFTVGGTASTSDVATIAVGESLLVPVEVSEEDIASVAVAQPATLSSATGQSAKAEVSSIAILPTSSSSAVTYTVNLVTTDTAAGLASGTSASAVIEVASANDAVLVPISAVTLTGDSTATARVGTQSERVDLKIGIRGTTHVEVLEGLSVGDSVVLSDSATEIPTSTSQSQGGSGIGSAPTGSGGFGGTSGMSGGGMGGPPR